jgi:hypothetical protein
LKLINLKFHEALKNIEKQKDDRWTTGFLGGLGKMRIFGQPEAPKKP